MLALILMFLFSLIVAAAAVWLYRSLSNGYGYNPRLQANPGRTAKMKLKDQRGFMFLASSRKHAGYKKPSNPKADPKVPWGW